MPQQIYLVCSSILKMVCIAGNPSKGKKAAKSRAASPITVDIDVTATSNGFAASPLAFVVPSYSRPGQQANAASEEQSTKDVAAVKPSSGSS